MKSLKLSNSNIVFIIAAFMSIISILFLNSYLINQISNFQSATNKEYASISMNAWVLFGICIMSLLILFLNLKKFIKIEKQIVSRKGITDKQIQTKNRFLSNMSHEIRSPLNCSSKKRDHYY